MVVLAEEEMEYSHRMDGSVGHKSLLWQKHEEKKYRARIRHIVGVMETRIFSS